MLGTWVAQKQAILEAFKMGIREKLNENPAVTTGATCGLIVVTLIWIFWSTFGGSRGSSSTGPKFFYSVDDGATYAPDVTEKAYTMAKIGGKDAAIAHVFSCDGTNRFVGYLERFTQQGDVAGGHEFKRPKETTWFKASTREGQAVLAGVKCPDGKGQPIEVIPD